MRASTASTLLLLSLFALGCPPSPPDPPPEEELADPAQSQLTVDRASGAVADGVDSVTLTVTIKSRSGRPMAGQQVYLSASGQQNTLSAPAPTGADGTTTATLRSTLAEEKTVTANIIQGALSQRATVTFVAGPVSPLTSTVQVSPASLPADGVAQALISVTLRDAQNNPVRGQPVVLSASGSGNTLVQPAVTNNQGATAGSLTSTRSEVKVISARAGSVELLQQPSALFLPGPAARLTFRVPPSSARTGAALSPAVQVAVEDAQGNLVATSDAELSLSLGTSPPGATLSGTTTARAFGGVATFANLRLSTAGTGYTLVATASGLPATTSPPFNISSSAPTRLVFLTQPANAAAGSPLGAFQVVLQDADGQLVNDAGAPQVTLALASSNNATLSGTTTVSPSGGVATFSDLSIDKAGTGYTLVATASGLTGATSQPFTVQPGAASRLLFSTQPAPAATASSALATVRVAVEDAFGNRVTSGSRSIELALGNNPSGGTLAGTTSRATEAGVAVFGDLSVDKVGAGYTLVASSNGLTSVASNAFDVSPGPAARLAFTVQPGASQSHTPLTPAVKVVVQDSQGNLVSGATNAIALALGTNPGGATLSGTLTASASGGEASFADLQLDRTGNGFTLVASATGLASATSTPFNVTPGPILGTRIVRHYLDSGESVLAPQDASATTIAAYVLQPDDSFTTFPGTGTADGRFTIPNVPVQPYYLRYGTLYFLTDSRRPDLGYYNHGRPDARRTDASSNTLLNLKLQQLDPWQETDDIQFYSSSVGSWDGNLGAHAVGGAAPNAGDVSLDLPVNYGQSLSPYLLEASRGDSAWFIQHGSRPLPSGGFYQAASRYFRTSTLTITPGASTDVVGAMTAIPQDRTLALDWKLAPSVPGSFGSYASQIFSTFAFYSQELYVSTFPRSGLGPYTGAPDVLTIATDPASALPRDITATLTYGDPLPAAWTRGVSASALFYAPISLPLPDGSSSTRVLVTASIGINNELSNLQASPLLPRLSPVRNITVNGQPTTARVDGVSETPLLAWQPPALGTPTHYRVELRELYLEGTRTRRGNVLARLHTTSTHVRVPPGILQTGRTYYALVRAQHTPGFSMERPSYTAWGSAYAEALTHVLAP